MAISVLVVEDESIVALDITRRLEKSGFTVTGTVGTGTDAISLAVRNPPDIVLMDIKIRGAIDGIETARQMQERMRVPVIFLTAYSDRQSIERAKQTSSFGYLLKPFHERELAIAIELALYKFSAEQEMQRNRSLLDGTLRGLSEGVIVVGKEEKILLLNRAAEQLTGWPSTEAVGLPVDTVFSTSGDDSENDSASSLGWRVLHTRNGGSVPVELTKTRQVDDERSGISTILVFRDITEIRRYERQLIRARDAAQAADEAKSQFLANMSHELRTPLNSIMGMAEFALELSKDDRQKEYIDILKGSARDLLELINGILDFAQIESGDASVENDWFDVAGIVEDILKDAAPGAYQKGLNVYLVSDPGLPSSFFGDAGKIRRILHNLVENAVKFTTRGWVMVELESEIPDEGLSVLHLWIRDSGGGIPEDRIPDAFRLFTQIDGSRTRSSGGLGLGLTVAERMVRLLGGKIDVSTSAATGSSFHVELALQSSGSDTLPDTLSDTNPDLLIVAGNAELFRTLSPWTRTSQAEICANDDVELPERASKASKIALVTTEQSRSSPTKPPEWNRKANLIIVGGPHSSRSTNGYAEGWVHPPIVVEGPLRRNELRELTSTGRITPSSRAVSLKRIEPDACRFHEKLLSLKTMIDAGQYEIVAREAQELRESFDGETASLLFRMVLAARKKDDNALREIYRVVSEEIL